MLKKKSFNVGIKSFCYKRYVVDGAQSVGDNAELEDIAKMPIDIGLFNLRISRRARKVQQPDGES